MLTSLRRTCGELGCKNALLYYVAEGLGRLSGQRLSLVRYLIVAQPVTDKPLVRRPDSTTVIDRVDAGDERIADFPRPADIIARRYAAGNLCLQATVGGAFAGFLWLAFGAYEEDEVRCRYELADPSRLVWDFDVFVDPRYRLGRSFGRLWDAANELLRGQGIQWSISRISAFNAASRAAHGRLGAVPLGHATFIRLGAIQLALLPGRILPWLSWNEASRPVLRLRGPEGQGRRAAD
jgi:hypothetical protein